jgi:hypothetical protein
VLLVAWLATAQRALAAKAAPELRAAGETKNFRGGRRRFATREPAHRAR